MSKTEEEKDYWWWEEETKILKAPERLKISEWSEKYRVLPSSAAEKGPLRLIRTPYLVPIMDACLEPNTEEVWFCKPAQIAGTEFAISTLGYFTHQYPSPCMMVMADEDTAKYMSKERIQRMYRDSEELSELIVEEKFNVGEITLKNDAYIALGWASSVAKLASRPMRFIIFDEIDKPGYSIASEEASPISLGIERTETFIDRKILGLSTPTKEYGNITKRLKACDVIYDFHVPCHACGQHQPLRWSSDHAYGFPEDKETKKRMYRGDDGKMHPFGGVVWEGSTAATEEQINKAGYACGECGAFWTNEQKNEAVLKFKMVARETPDRTLKRVGFHINRLYSLLAKSGSIPKLVEDFIRCMKVIHEDKKEIQGFINSTLAEPYIEYAGKDRRAEEVLKLKTENKEGLVPSWALALYMTADVQENGVWYELRAWDLDGTSMLIKYGFLMKTQTSNGMAGDLAALKGLIEANYESAQKDKFIVRMAIIDSGYRTDEVYDFCRGIPQAHPSKGQEVKKVPITYTKIDTYPGSSKLLPGGVQLISFDSNYFKDQLLTKLSVNPSDVGAWRLHSNTDETYANQYVSEFKSEENGLWQQKSRTENHLWDCGTLQLVANHIVKSQGLLEKLAKERELRSKPKPPKQQQMPKEKMW